MHTFKLSFLSEEINKQYQTPGTNYIILKPHKMIFTFLGYRFLENLFTVFF